MNICTRFITDGIRATVAHYERDELPLHRLSWELRTRIDTLVPHAPAVWIDQLRDLQRRVAETALAEHGDLTPTESATINDSLRMLTDALDKPARTT